MKKLTIPIVLGLLCLSFWARGQDPATDVTAQGLQIGQKVPNVTLTNLHNFKDKSGKPSNTAKLSDFEGKLLIIDFWATWCSPCIAMIPKMDSLQKQFGDKIQFISATYQKQDEVLTFLKTYEKQRRVKFKLPLITDSKDLHLLFPHVSLPHYVWIDKNGIVKGITRSDEITFGNIERILNSEFASLLEKKELALIPFSKDVPLLVDGNGGSKADLLYHSIITKYSGKLIAGYTVKHDKNDEWKITALDQPLIKLYRLAYGRNREYLNNSTVSIRVQDPNKITSTLRGNDYLHWKKDNAFSYELIAPPHMTRDEVFGFMKEDLKRFFTQYTVREELQKKKAFVLERTTTSENYLTKGGEPAAIFNQEGMELKNSFLQTLLLNLNALYQQKAKYPLVDRSGITGRVDIKLKANLSDMDSINLGLQKYGLQFIEREIDVKLLVITDSDNIK